MSIKVALYDSKRYDQRSFTSALSQLALETQYQLVFLEPRLDINTVEFCRGCDAVCTFVNDDLSAEVLVALDDMGIQLVLMRCAGFDRVDLKASEKLGISVTRVPAYSPYAVAEFATALLLTVVRKTHRAFNRVRDGNFSLAGLVGFDLHKKTVGVIGTGKIGQCFINIMLGFGCHVLGYDPYPNTEFAKKKGSANFRYVTLSELYAESDIISLHVPLTKETTHLINRQALNEMKQGVILLNTARGPLVDAKALVENLISGRVGGAGLDVYENESQYFFRDVSDEAIEDDVLARLQNMQNVIFTSHQAFLTNEALQAIAVTTFSSLKEFFVERKRLKDLTYYIEPPAEPAALVRALTRKASINETSSATK